MTIFSLPTRIDGAHTHRFVGILDHQLVGYCELALTNEQAHVATLFSVYVDPTHRGKGYARRLVSAAIEAAQAQGKTAVNLRVQEANITALNLYKSLGFGWYEGPDEGFVGLMYNIS
jgi:ribosomal protein S18 acetylase RimI-like enzyme